ncbi:MAG: hypothetical protein J5617_00335 [Bacilli bacterium]|nr:hypothetical protein [Bacilli bacterium]
MSKKFLVISLAIIAVIGSIWTFYASNMFFSDVSNFGAGFMNTTLFVSLTGMLLGAMMVAAPLFIVRFYQRPNSRKVLCRNYLFIAIALAAFGLIFAVLGGVINYRGNFVKYPFPGYLIIMIVLHLTVLVGSAVVLFMKVLKMPEDTEKYKVTVKHVFHTLGLYLLIALAFNRFGAFLLMPVYCQFSTLYKTFVYYLFLLVPMVILAIKLMRILEVGKNRFLMSLITLIVTTGLMVAILLLGKNDSSFISAVSAAAPLERLGSMPMELFIHFFSYFGVLLYYVIIEKLKKA